MVWRCPSTGWDIIPYDNRFYVVYYKGEMRALYN
jgi:hypothetical protein